MGMGKFRWVWESLRDHWLTREVDRKLRVSRIMSSASPYECCAHTTQQTIVYERQLYHVCRQRAGGNSCCKGTPFCMHELDVSSELCSPCGGWGPFPSLACAIRPFRGTRESMFFSVLFFLVLFFILLPSRHLLCCECRELQISWTWLAGRAGARRRKGRAGSRFLHG